MHKRSFLCGVGAALLFAAQLCSAAGSLIISEFRLRGPNGVNDEFVEIYNDSASAHTVAASSGTGYALVASDGVIRFSIPNGTVIPARGHFLGVNSVGYSISPPAGDVTYTTDIPDNAGIALFNNNIVANFTLANRFDAVGSTTEANTLYKEGTGYPALAPFSINYAFTRDSCGKGGAVNVMGPCTISTPKDTDNNAVDFYSDDTNGTSAGAGQRLGAPSPSNLASPINNGTGLTIAPLDGCTGNGNFVRDFTSNPAANSTFGTITTRYTITNNTGVALSALNFHVVDIDTFPAASGFADLRTRTSTSTTVIGVQTSCASPLVNVTVQGVTLVQPPAQPNGGGFDTVFSVGAVTPGTPLAPGASINVQFLFGIPQTGQFRYAMVPEGLPQAGVGGGVLALQCASTDTCAGPTVTINQAVAQADPTAASPINFTVTFSEAVNNFTASDITLSGTAGATTAVVSGSGPVYNVAVSGMTTNGTVIASIAAGAANSVATGFPSAASTSTDNTVTYNGNTISVTINQAVGQSDPASTSPINFTVTFSAAVNNFTASDVTLGGTAGATTATVTGSGAVYNVAVSGMSASGTVTASIPAGAANAISNGAPNTASTSTDNTVTFALAPPAPAAPAPTLSTWLMALLAGALALSAMIVRRMRA